MASNKGYDDHPVGSDANLTAALSKGKAKKKKAPTQKLKPTLTKAKEKAPTPKLKPTDSGQSKRVLADNLQNIIERKKSKSHAGEPAQKLVTLGSSRRRSAIAPKKHDSEPDWEDDEEFVSTNNNPSGPHEEDYTKHLFRLPPNGPAIARKWLQRETSDPGYLGRKTYAPQVGDTVVYIPRAHLELVGEFPGVKAPWQDWPPEAVWPVVCCSIRDVRYRFPYINHYESTNRTPCKSIVAILSLEVTGVPVLDQDRDFNWPDPNFIPPARSHLFELDLFESEFDEFLIPYDTYVWRLRCLEEAIYNNRGLTHGLEISAYYENDEDNSPDGDLILYRGFLHAYAQNDHHYKDESLNNCGYLSICIRWPENNKQDALSPWETIMEKPNSKSYSLTRHCLDDEQKQRAREALNNLKGIPSVCTHLTLPVCGRYVDYNLRVEVPLCLDLVQRRLDNNYYTSRWSVVADVKLIRDNCIKYHGETGVLQDEARQMLQQFENDMLSEQERQVFNNLGVRVCSLAVAEGAFGNEVGVEARNAERREVPSEDGNPSRGAQNPNPEETHSAARHDETSIGNPSGADAQSTEETPSAAREASIGNPSGADAQNPEETPSAARHDPSEASLYEQLLKVDEIRKALPPNQWQRLLKDKPLWKTPDQTELASVDAVDKDEAIPHSLLGKMKMIRRVYESLTPEDRELLKDNFGVSN